MCVFFYICTQKIKLLQFSQWVWQCFEGQEYQTSVWKMCRNPFLLSLLWQMDLTALFTCMNIREWVSTVSSGPLWLPVCFLSFVPVLSPSGVVVFGKKEEGWFWRAGRVSKQTSSLHGLWDVWQWRRGEITCCVSLWNVFGTREQISIVKMVRLVSVDGGRHQSQKEGEAGER